MTDQELHNIRERHEKVRGFIATRSPDVGDYCRSLFDDVGALLESVQFVPDPPAAA